MARTEIREVLESWSAAGSRSRPPRRAWSVTRCSTLALRVSTPPGPDARACPRRCWPRARRPSRWSRSSERWLSVAAKPWSLPERMKQSGALGRPTKAVWAHARRSHHPSATVVPAIAPLTDVGTWVRGKGLEIVLFVLGAVLLVRLIHWAADRITSRIDSASAPDDPALRSEASKHRHTIAQALRWLATGLIWAVTVALVLDRFGVPFTRLAVPATVVGAREGPDRRHLHHRRRSRATYHPAGLERKPGRWFYCGFGPSPFSSSWPQASDASPCRLAPPTGPSSRARRKPAQPVREPSLVRRRGSSVGLPPRGACFPRPGHRRGSHHGRRRPP